MKQFFKFLLASLLALILFFGIFFVIGIASIPKEKKKPGPEKTTVLHLNMSNQISDKASADFNFNGSDFKLDRKFSLYDYIKAMDSAKNDERVKGLYLDFTNGTYIARANATEFRDAISSFKESGKFVVAYAEVLTPYSYYLASVADELYVYPEGAVIFNGIGAELMFMKNMFNKLGIEMQVIRGSNNKFKSAVEPFINEKMSDANREQLSKYLFSYWNSMLTDISKDRGVSIDDLNLIADSLKAQNIEDAVKYKLVTGAKYGDEIQQLLKDKAGITGDTDKKDKDGKERENTHLFKFSAYVKRVIKRNKYQNRSPNIAIVYASGEIVDGKGESDQIGSKTLVRHIREVRKNDSIKALVLRVNSPGGSALASDVIWREINITKEKKPVIVSMGNLAASGGYYISCNADRIFAQPTTITGSIGVFGLIPNMQKFFNDKLGITFDEVETNPHANLTVSKPLTEEEYKIIQKGVDEIYDDFISKVANGRNITKAQVDSIGQGRIWTGEDALEIGLVDELGSLEDAINFAQEKAGLEKAKVAVFPRKKKKDFEAFVEKILENSSSIVTENYGKQKISEKLLNQLDKLDQIENLNTYQARLPYEIIFNK